MSTLPDFTGPGFFAGEAPDGLTTIAGTPTSAQVRVYWRDPADPQAPDALVASTQSAADGTWQIAGLNPALRYVVRAQKSQFDDVTVVGAMPARSDVIVYVDNLAPREDEFGDVDGLTGHVLLDSGLPPFTCEVIQPLPYGLSARIEGRKLLIDGASTDNGVWSSVVRVTASNAVWVDVPVQVQIQVLLDPHWDKVVALLHFNGDLTDEADPDRVWRGSYVASPQSGVRGSTALDKTARISVPDSGAGLPTPWVFYKEPCTLEFFLRRDSSSDTGNIISLWGGNIRFKCEVLNSNLVFTAFIGAIRTMSFALPFIDSNLEHIAIVRGENGIFSAFRQGVKLPQTYGPYSGEVYAGTGLSVTAGGVTFDELRISKGVARYTENFTPPTNQFPHR